MSPMQANDQDRTAPVDAIGTYLTFQLGDEVYGIKIMQVQEIVGLMPVTRVPRMPHFVRGVVNLRGRVVPVMTLADVLHLETVETERSCIIVTQPEIQGHQLTVGLFVDAVNEVLEVTAANVEPVPEFGADVDTRFLIGITKVDDRVVMLLDIDAVMTNEQAGHLQRLT